jgi:hypothetical protein
MVHDLMGCCTSRPNRYELKMKSKLQKLSEIVARANDVFYSKFDNIDTLMGIMEANFIS